MKRSRAVHSVTPLAILTTILFTTSSAAPPSGWTTYPEDTVALEGSQLTFHCQPTTPNTFLLLRVNKLEDSGPVLILNDTTYSVIERTSPLAATLTIKNFTKAAEGRYFCRALHRSTANDLIGPVAWYTIAVAPKAVAGQSGVVLTEDTPGNVSCQFDGVPAPNITLFRGGSTALLVRNGATKLDYPISKVEKSNAGNYTCKAVNIAGKAEFTYGVTVEYKPSIITKPETKRASNGSVVYFECQVDGLPTPSIAWSHNGTAVDARRVSPNGTLSVMILSLNDTGMYSCEANNPHGSDKKNFQLVVKVPPGPPGKPVVTSFGADFVVLEWTSGFDGHGTISGYKIQFQTAPNRWEQYKEGKTIDGSPARLDDLIPDSNYYFKMKAVNEVGRSDFSQSSEEVVTNPLPPPKVENVGISDVKPTEFTVTWDAPLNLQATHGKLRLYTVRYFATGAGVNGAKFVNTTDETDKDMTIQGLAKGTEYTVNVAAYNRAALGAYSDAQTETTSTTVPGPVTNLLALSLTDTLVQLRWIFPDDLGGLPVTSIEIKYKTDQSTVWEPTGVSPSPDAADATVSGLTEKTAYTFQVVISNGEGSSTPAESNAVTTPSNMAPSQPTLRTVSPPLDDQVTLTWVDNGDHKATLWKIEQKTTTTEWETSKDSIDGNRFIARDLTPNTTYYFRLQGENQAGDGPYSSELSITTAPKQPPSPIQLAIKPSIKEASVTWTLPSNEDASALTLELSWTQVGSNEVKSQDVDDVAKGEYTLTALEPNATYLVWMTTVKDGLQSKSQEVNFTTKIETDVLPGSGGGGGGLSTGIIVAIASVSGGIALIFIICLSVWCCSKKDKQKYDVNGNNDRRSSWIDGPDDSTSWYRESFRKPAEDSNRYDALPSNGHQTAEAMNSTTLSYAELQFLSPHHRPPRVRDGARESTPYAEIDYNEMDRQVVARSRSQSEEVDLQITTFDVERGAVVEKAPLSPALPSFEPLVSPTFESDV